MIPSPFISVSSQLIPPPFVGMGMKNPFGKIKIFPQPIHDRVVPEMAMKRGGKVKNKKKK